MHILKLIPKTNYHGLKGSFNNEYTYIEIAYIPHKSQLFSSIVSLNKELCYSCLWKYT